MDGGSTAHLNRRDRIMFGRSQTVRDFKCVYINDFVHLGPYRWISNQPIALIKRSSSRAGLYHRGQLRFIKRNLAIQLFALDCLMVDLRRKALNFKAQFRIGHASYMQKFAVAMLVRNVDLPANFQFRRLCNMRPLAPFVRES